MEFNLDWLLKTDYTTPSNFFDPHRDFAGWNFPAIPRFSLDLP